MLDSHPSHHEASKSKKKMLELQYSHNSATEEQQAPEDDKDSAQHFGEHKPQAVVKFEDKDEHEAGENSAKSTDTPGSVSKSNAMDRNPQGPVVTVEIAQGSESGEEREGEQEVGGGGEGLAQRTSKSKKKMLVSSTAPVHEETSSVAVYSSTDPQSEQDKNAPGHHSDESETLRDKPQERLLGGSDSERVRGHPSQSRPLERINGGRNITDHSDQAQTTDSVEQQAEAVDHNPSLVDKEGSSLKEQGESSHKHVENNSPRIEEANSLFNEEHKGSVTMRKGQQETNPSLFQQGVGHSSKLEQEGDTERDEQDVTAVRNHKEIIESPKEPESTPMFVQEEELSQLSVNVQHPTAVRIFSHEVDNSLHHRKKFRSEIFEDDQQEAVHNNKQDQVRSTKLTGKQSHTVVKNVEVERMEHELKDESGDSGEEEDVRMEINPGEDDDSQSDGFAAGDREDNVAAGRWKSASSLATDRSGEAEPGDDDSVQLNDDLKLSDDAASYHVENSNDDAKGDDDIDSDEGSEGDEEGPSSSADDDDERKSSVDSDSGAENVEDADSKNEKSHRKIKIRILNPADHNNNRRNKMKSRMRNRMKNNMKIHLKHNEKGNRKHNMNEDMKHNIKDNMHEDVKNDEDMKLLSPEDAENIQMLTSVVDQYTQELNEQQSVLNKIIHDTEHAQQMLHNKEAIQQDLVTGIQHQEDRLRQETEDLLKRIADASDEAQRSLGSDDDEMVKESTSESKHSRIHAGKKAQELLWKVVQASKQAQPSTGSEEEQMIESSDNRRKLIPDDLLSKVLPMSSHAQLSEDKEETTDESGENDDSREKKRKPISDGRKTEHQLQMVSNASKQAQLSVETKEGLDDSRGSNDQPIPGGKETESQLRTVAQASKQTQLSKSTDATIEESGEHKNRLLPDGKQDHLPIGNEELVEKNTQNTHPPVSDGEEKVISTMTPLGGKDSEVKAGQVSKVNQAELTSLGKEKIPNKQNVSSDLGEPSSAGTGPGQVQVQTTGTGSKQPGQGQSQSQIIGADGEQSHDKKQKLLIQIAQKVSATLAERANHTAQVKTNHADKNGSKGKEAGSQGEAVSQQTATKPPVLPKQAVDLLRVIASLKSSSTDKEKGLSSTVHDHTENNQHKDAAPSQAGLQHPSKDSEATKSSQPQEQQALKDEDDLFALLNVNLQSEINSLNEGSLSENKHPARKTGEAFKIVSEKWRGASESNAFGKPSSDTRERTQHLSPAFSKEAPAASHTSRVNPASSGHSGAREKTSDLSHVNKEAWVASLSFPSKPEFSDVTEGEFGNSSTHDVTSQKKASSSASVFTRLWVDFDHTLGIFLCFYVMYR
jgi:hypothetical protein